MIRNVSIENFKSILNDSFELGRVNVFIGENGSGKTNILEALGMVGAGLDRKLDVESLYHKGVRVSKPNLTVSSFLNFPGKEIIKIGTTTSGEEPYPLSFQFRSIEENDINSSWYLDIVFKKEMGETPEKDKIKELGGFLQKYLGFPASNVIIPAAPFNQLGNSLLDLINLTFSGAKKGALPPKYPLTDFLIYAFETQALRGITSESKRSPLGIHGEGLDVLINSLDKEAKLKLLEHDYLISWLKEFFIDEGDQLKFEGHKLGRSTSRLYFKDQFMRRNNNVFSAENANEGALHVLGYLALFLSKQTPNMFAIDNIENGLNPKVCRELIKALAKLAEENNKQVLITTHNPAVLDGLNLHDDEQRLFVVYRNQDGHSKTKRIQMKPETSEGNLKLSEMWMRGYLGGIPTNF
ncbi:MAG: ATP-binding protein [Bacteroidia bacterium]|nr:ATP-binding protein [Bacteroidia bacterium]